MLSKKLNTNYTFFNKNVDNSWDGYVLVFVGQEKMGPMMSTNIKKMSATLVFLTPAEAELSKKNYSKVLREFLKVVKCKVSI
jgi:hypothetical protein